MNLLLYQCCFINLYKIFYIFLFKVKNKMFSTAYFTFFIGLVTHFHAVYAYARLGATYNVVV